MSLKKILKTSIQYLSPPFKERYGKLFADEHLEKIVRRLEDYSLDFRAPSLPPPYFEEEITPPLKEIFSPFDQHLAAWKEGKKEPEKWAQILEKAGCPSLLLILGQRLTPASLQDERAIPPRSSTLLDWANGEYKQGLTVAARAWTKHHHRTENTEFWGSPRGSVEDKNRGAEKILEKILDEGTWWNVFGHYKAGVVYEVRRPTGHGARWSLRDGAFVGFLEPFSSEEGF